MLGRLFFWIGFNGSTSKQREAIIEPCSLPYIREIFPDDWMIRQKFLKNGKEIIVVGFGRDRLDAFFDFQAELELEKLT